MPLPASPSRGSLTHAAARAPPLRLGRTGRLPGCEGLVGAQKHVRTRIPPRRLFSGPRRCCSRPVPGQFGMSAALISSSWSHKACRPRPCKGSAVLVTTIPRGRGSRHLLSEGGVYGSSHDGSKGTRNDVAWTVRVPRLARECCQRETRGEEDVEHREFKAGTCRHRPGPGRCGGVERAVRVGAR